nr:uncharacterized protein [Tanacetum cinerariifolium]
MGVSSYDHVMIRANDGNKHLADSLRLFSHDLKAKEPHSEKKRKKSSNKEDTAPPSLVHIDPLGSNLLNFFPEGNWLSFHRDSPIIHTLMVHDMKVLLHDIDAEGMTFSETFQLDGKGKGKNDKKSKREAEYLAPEAGIMPKRVTSRQANMVNDNVDMIAMVFDAIAMISKVNLVGSNNSDWWVDIEAIRYVCDDKSMFHSFRVVDNGDKLHMGNYATADIKGEEDVILKMTSEKELKLANVLYVLEIYGKKTIISILKSVGCLAKETGSLSIIDDEVAQDKRQQDDNDLQDETQDQPEEEEVKPRRSKKARTEKSFGPDFVSFMVKRNPLLIEKR